MFAGTFQAFSRELEQRGGSGFVDIKIQPFKNRTVIGMRRAGTTGRFMQIFESPLKSAEALKVFRRKESTVVIDWMRIHSEETYKTYR